MISVLVIKFCSNKNWRVNGWNQSIYLSYPEHFPFFDFLSGLLFLGFMWLQKFWFVFTSHRASTLPFLMRFRYNIQACASRIKKAPIGAWLYAGDKNGCCCFAYKKSNWDGPGSWSNETGGIWNSQEAGQNANRNFRSSGLAPKREVVENGNLGGVFLDNK